MARIVVIDDEEDLRGYVEFHLNRRGHTVLCARDGFEGIGLVEEYRPDLIILDVMMPMLDGVEICKRLKCHDEIGRIPVIFLTARTGVCHRLRGIESGGEIYITKPFEIEDLAAQVNAILTREEHRGDHRFSRLATN